MEALDETIFRYVNSLEHPAMDQVMLFLTGPSIWILGIICFPTFAAIKRRWDLVRIFLLAAAAVGIADSLSSQILKPFFARYRPCRTLEMVRLFELSGCAGRYGFPSNHAANAFAAGIFCCLYGSRRFGFSMLSLAVLIGFSRIYVGVHYPLDVLFGFSVGGAVACAVYCCDRSLNITASHR